MFLALTTIGHPVPGRVTHTTLALYPLPVRRIRDFVISFLQIPPRDGHPCLDGWFQSLRSIGDSHPLNATSYSTHQAGRPVPFEYLLKCSDPAGSHKGYEKPGVNRSASRQRGRERS